jgi:hypothetical protein
LSYDVDFNTFKDLIKKVIANQISETSSDQIEKEDNVIGGVRFISKKKL